MNGDISIDLGNVIPYAEQRLLSIFGRDEVSQEWKRRLKDLARVSLQQASYVQSVGMHTPVPIQKIYQPTQLIKQSNHTASAISVQDLIRSREDAIIFAGPGRGKTTLLHHLYMSLSGNDLVVPILFTLRWADVPKQLIELVDYLCRKSSSKQRILFLVDGYDEVTSEDRELISRALMLFKAHNLGQFLLTCRTLYQVYDLRANQYDLDAFSHADAVRFVEAFSEIYGVKLNASRLIRDLESRGFADFISHPLMLTLVCILRTGPNADIPSTTVL